MRTLSQTELFHVTGGTKTSSCAPAPRPACGGGLLAGVGMTLFGVKKIALSLLAAPLVLIGSLFSHGHGSCSSSCSPCGGDSAAS